MKKVLMFIFFSIFAASFFYSQYRTYPAYGKIYTINDSEVDRKQFKEVTFDEVNEIYDTAIKTENTDSLRNIKFKTKCHITSISKVHSTNWKKLTLYCNGTSLYDFLVPKGYLLPDTALFESVEIYYYFVVYIDGTVERKDFGIEFLLDGRFAGFRYKAADNLKIRETPSLDSEKIGLISKYENVTILEVGQKEIIDRIESVWVKVRTDDGKEGWSFGGYLTDGYLYFQKYSWE